jgi:ParB/RepB/Spo0J family partition protein
LKTDDTEATSPGPDPGDLTASCPKCGREMGEHNGTKCPRRSLASPPPKRHLANDAQAPITPWTCRGRPMKLMGAECGYVNTVATIDGQGTGSATEVCGKCGCVKPGHGMPGKPSKRQPPAARGGAREDESPASTEPAASAAAPSPGRYEPALMLDLIEPSPHNRNAKTHLEELARSIREKGVINPITVRPVASYFEIVAGERRWRAARIAGLHSIPALVRELTDVEVLEVQLIENVQREDVHPLEEADGYKLLIDRHGYTVDKIVEKTGKSKGWVYGRLKLCSLAKLPRQAFLDGKLAPSIALMVARIPTQALQEQATAGVLGQAGWQEYQGSGVSVGELGNDVEPLSTKQAAAYIQSRFMLRLELARFDTADRTLVPKVGACTDCIHRTGNQRDLFAEVASADLCTNPPCHEAKTKAGFERAAAEAAAKGVEVLKGKKAEGLFDNHSGSPKLSYQARQEYFDPTDEVPYDLAPSAKKPPTWSKLLGKELDSVPRKVVQDDTGAARTIYLRKDAERALVAAGKVPKKSERASSSSGGDESYAAQQRKRQADHKRRKEVVAAALRKLHGAAVGAYVEGAGQLAADWWRWVTLALLDLVSADDQVAVARAFDLEVKTSASSRSGGEAALRKEIATAGVPTCRGLVVALLAARDASGGSYSNGYGSAFTDACKHFKVDLKRLAAEVAQAASAKAKTSAKAAPKTKPSKKSVKKAGGK